MSKIKIFFLFGFLSMVGCTSSNQYEDREVIIFDCQEHATFSSINEIFSDGHFLIPNDGEDKAMMFSEPEQIMYKNGKLYISDWKNGKIIIFNDNGTPELCLCKKGRGPQEYLRISYFDIDKNGNIWILDGQRDRLLRYAQDGSFLSAFDLDYEVNHIKCLDNGNFLLGLAPWDNSRYKNKKILILDKDMKVISACLDSGKYSDPNFEFQSQGFITTENGIFYHTPVDDYVYFLTLDGKYEKSYYVDFGSYVFPKEVRKNIQSHYEKIDNYRALVNTVYIDENRFVGSFLDKGRFMDFIIDRQSDILYLKDGSYASMHLIGVSGNYAIFYIPAGYEGDIPYMPDTVKAEYDLGKDLFLILDINAIK